MQNKTYITYKLLSGIAQLEDLYKYNVYFYWSNVV